MPQQPAQEPLAANTTKVRRVGMINTNDPRQKVRAEHLQRDAYLYIRQSTLQQVFHNTESTQRQYDLKQRAIALGWPAERVLIIDGDQGQSGASAADREGFQKLVAEVGLGHAGIVLGLEVSRLARNCSDWHRLLEICGLTDTLILDEDGLYDPSSFNDRLLLGLKGTMSEAELHVLRARLQGGSRNKAQRGELRFALPVGLIYDPQGRLVLDPDQQVQQALRTFFQVYERQGTARAVVKYFAQNHLSFPRRLRGGIHKGQLVWGPLGHSRKRFGKYGLTLHPEKTRLIPFQRPRRRPDRQGPPSARRPGTFDLLGFTHYWGLSRKGFWVVKRRTASSRFTRAVRTIAQWYRLHRHLPVREQHQTLSQKLRGHFAYYGITGNAMALSRYRQVVTNLWRKWLGRRRRDGALSWQHFVRLMERYPLPTVEVVHSVYRRAAKP